MNIIITMAGLGSRFRKAGYDCPKFMIEACGKTLFEWSMDSLLDYNPSTKSYIFIVRKEDNATTFIKEHFAKYGISNFKILELDHITDGQATTALLGVDAVDDEDDSVLIYNIDTYIEPYSLKMTDLTGDGSIPCFKADGDHWSFVKVENGKVVDVVEKVRISDNCSLGSYYFKSSRLYKEIYHEFYENSLVGLKEKYIAPMYKYMLDKGYEITYSLVNPKTVHVLGTPEELELFVATRT